MTDLRDRIIDALFESAATIPDLTKRLGAKPGLIQRELISLQSEKRIRVSIKGVWSPRIERETQQAIPAAVANGGADESHDSETLPDVSEVSAEPPGTRRQHRVTTDMKRRAADQKARIIVLLERHGALRAPRVLELLADPSLTMKDVQNRLTYMRQMGEVESTGRGYALVNGAKHETSNAATRTIGRTRRSIGRCSSACEKRINGEPDAVGAEATEQRGGRYLTGNGGQMPAGVFVTKLEDTEFASPRAEVRAELLDLVHALRTGTCTAEAGKVAIEALQYVVAIDDEATA